MEFTTNDANRQMNATTTFPFYTREGWNIAQPNPSDLPLKGDVAIGDDVWIRRNAIILPNGGRLAVVPTATRERP